MDMAGARMFLNLQAEIAKRGVAFRLVEARSSVRDILRMEGIEDKIGPIDRFTMLADAIDDFQNTNVVAGVSDSGSSAATP